MLSIYEIRERLSKMNLATVARATNLSYMTVWSIARGYKEGFNYRTIEKIANYLESIEKSQ